MPTVELVFDHDCPNVDDARAQLRRAFERLHLEPKWTEWQGDAPDAPERLRGLGSPTILVDGRDVAGDPDASDACCRVYAQTDGSLRGVPEVEAILGAIDEARQHHDPAAETGSAGPRPGGGSPPIPWKSHLTLLPAVGAALLPSLACPACWPAYAGFLGALGLGFLIHARYLLPLTALALLLALGALAFRARRRWGYRPFALGLIASALVLAGKFGLHSEPVTYVGLALLLLASLWNGWPRRDAACDSCAAVPAP